MFCSRVCYDKHRWTDAMDRLSKKYVVSNSGCWIWTGAKMAKGYGKMWLLGKLIGAHRASWELHRGQVPKGLHVLHSCDTPECINPNHLFLGTNHDNIVDRNNKRSRRKKTSRIATSAP